LTAAPPSTLRLRRRPRGAIVALSFAACGSSASLRVCDPLLPRPDDRVRRRPRHGGADGDRVRDRVWRAAARVRPDRRSLRQVSRHHTRAGCAASALTRDGLRAGADVRLARRRAPHRRGHDGRAHSAVARVDRRHDPLRAAPAGARALSCSARCSASRSGS
jgi:hypothetical protein